MFFSKQPLLKSLVPLLRAILLHNRNKIPMFREIALRDPRSGRILPISTNHALDNSDIFPAPGEGRRC